MPDTRHTPARILFTIPNFITAGSGQALLNIVLRLDRERFAPAICVLKSGGRLESTIREHQIPLYELPFLVAPRPLPTLPARLWNAARQFRPYRFDLWHSYHYADDYTEPLIARFAGARAWIYTKKNMNWGGRAWRVRTFLAARVAAQNAEMIERFFAAKRTRAKTRLLPRGVDTEKFRPGLPAALNVRQQLGLSAQTPLIGCVANLLPIKGHALLIRAFASVPDAALVLAGKALDTAYFETLKKLCADLGVAERVHFIGDIQNVPAFNSELDIFAFPSITKGEGCPVALLEALACGVACVATDVPGSRDLIEPGISGLVVPPDDEHALAQALRTLLDSVEMRRQLGAAARARVMAQYTIEREVAAHEALYAEVLAQRRGGEKSW